MSTTEKRCSNCLNQCMDMDMDPYCAAVNKPWGQVLHRGIPKECDIDERRLWQLDTRRNKKETMATEIREPYSILKDTNLNVLAQECYQNAKDHGFYDPPPALEERLILIVSEVTEILEEHRDGRAPTDVRYSANRGTAFDTQKPEGIPSEFADVIIRVLDACAYYGIDIDTAVREKMAYNKTRPHKHGRVR